MLYIESGHKLFLFFISILKYISIGKKVYFKYIFHSKLDLNVLSYFLFKYMYIW